jgi:hypothetical protein
MGRQLAGRTAQARARSDHLESWGREVELWKTSLLEQLMSDRPNREPVHLDRTLL